MSEELKLCGCPFGCPKPVTLSDYTDKPRAAWLLVHRCDVIGPIFVEGHSGEQLAAAWNTRAKPVVKALEWEMRDRWYAEFPQLMAAYTIFFEQGKWWIAEIADAPPFDTDAAAKEYAQEHVNNRVLACLEGYDD